MWYVCSRVCRIGEVGSMGLCGRYVVEYVG